MTKRYQFTNQDRGKARFSKHLKFYEIFSRQIKENRFGYAQTQQIERALAEVPRSFRKAYLIAMGGRSRKKAIQIYCLQCAGWKRKQVAACPNAADLWHVKKIPPQQMEHLTSKPVELAVRSIQYSSLQGDNVLDHFGGSGSTLNSRYSSVSSRPRLAKNSRPAWIKSAMLVLAAAGINSRRN